MPGPLSHLRVVEISSGLAAAYTAKLLADLGADVVKVEPPQGDIARRLGPFPGGRVDPETSGLFVYLNANKRGIVLDLAAGAERRRLARLLDAVDVLVHEVPVNEMTALGIDPAQVLRDRPRLVATSITPFGLSGPHAAYRAYDLNLWNAGGVACLNGAGPGGDDLPPLRAFGYQSAFQAGLNAAFASLGAVYARDSTGAGQHVEVSIQECLVTILELTYPFWPYCQLVASRLGNKPIQPLEFFECRDGWVFLCAVEEHQWKTFVEVMGSPDWAALEIFSDRLQRGANWDALKPMIAEWMAEQTVQELYTLLQSRRVPIAPVSTMGDLLASKHLQARGFFVGFAHPRAGVLRMPGAPYQFSRTPWELRLPAPQLGQHTDEVLAEIGAPRS
ncbi:MAG TPA: CoA transferase [Candidatus Binatia bacterium]|nr:CoA transferase [Candidatus Binatia bacterium]